MSGRVHKYSESLLVGELHEYVLDGLLKSRGWQVVEATHEEQRSGIDRWVYRDGVARAVEYKADIRADETGNYALEILGYVPEGDGDVRMGWALKSAAEWFVLYRPASGVAHFVKADLLQRCVRRWFTQHRFSPVRNEGFASLVLLVPCKLVDAIAAQRVLVDPP